LLRHRQNKKQKEKKEQKKNENGRGCKYTRGGYTSSVITTHAKPLGRAST
jgi:hypothetical protein